MPLIPFSNDDLAANDDGFLTDSQKTRLKPITDLYIALCVIAAFMCSITAAVFFYVDRGKNEYFFLTTACMIVFGVFVYGAVWSLARSKRIKNGIGVKKAEGFAESYIIYTGKNADIPNFRLKIQNVVFRLDRTVYNAFTNGNYRIYYYPLLRNEFLSLEPIS